MILYSVLIVTSIVILVIILWKIETNVPKVPKIKEGDKEAKIKSIINSSLFKSGIAVAIGLILLAESHPLYAGIALGIALREFLLAFSKL